MKTVDWLPKTDMMLMMSKLRVDWAKLITDMSVRQIVVDLPEGRCMKYDRRQTHSSGACLWVGERDFGHPDGLQVIELMELYPSGYYISKRFVRGFEPPHTHPTTVECVFCRDYATA